MNTAQTFAGGTAVITGAGSGIGEALAMHAAALGMNVVVAERSVERGERVAQAIRAQGGRALFVPTDVADRASMLALARATHDTFGDVRLLINNAGISVIGVLWEIAPDDWQRAIDINLLGVLHGIQAFVPRMLEVGATAYVANVASLAAVSTAPDAAPYFTTKHAVLALSESLHVDLQKRGAPIKVAMVAPGLVATRIFEDALARSAGDDQQRQFMRGLAAQAGMPPAEAARLIVEGIASGAFWVATHPGPLAYLANERAEYLRALALPQPSNERAALGPNN